MGLKFMVSGIIWFHFVGVTKQFESSGDEWEVVTSICSNDIFWMVVDTIFGETFILNIIFANRFPVSVLMIRGYHGPWILIPRWGGFCMLVVHLVSIVKGRVKRS